MDAVQDAVMPTAHRTPRIIAHRGSNQYLPEQTLKAYVRAIAEGADALECDVRLTADSHLVCVHDRRVDRTSNGKGSVSTLELATLQGLDFGSWTRAHGADVEIPDLDPERDMLLTLHHLINTTLSCGREVGLDGAYVPGRPHVCVMSTSHVAIARMQQLCPEVPLVYLMRDSVPLRFRDGGLPKGSQIAGLDKAIIQRWPKTVKRQHDRGHQVYVWTVDDVADIDRCLELEVDGIISNRPAFARDYVFGND